MARTDARERIRAQSVTRIGPSVYLVRPLGTMVLRNVGTAIAVPVGCFRDADQVFNLVRVHCAPLSVERLFHSGDGVFLDGAIHAPHDLPGTILLLFGDFDVTKLFACGVAGRRTRCEFDRAADKCKISSDEDFVRLQLYLKTASPNHLSIVFPALLPGLHWVTKLVLNRGRVLEG
jgi:hypothetical protein